jgi:hypothetical protein
MPPSSPSCSSDIARLGFRKWYERRLIEAHAWLVTAFLCVIVIAAGLEGLTFKGSLLAALGSAGLVFFAGLIAWHGVRRFIAILAEAEHLGSQSTCQSCNRYAAFSVIAQSPRMSVRCRKCGHEWTFH